MSDQSNQLAVQTPRALQSVAALTGLDQQYIVATLKAQCFKGQATDSQVDAFISIAMEMKVNPLLPGMLYAYPVSGGGIVPIMGPSGVYKKLTEHPDVDSWNVKVYPEDVTQPPTHAVAQIFRKSTDRPLEYTASLSEWKIGTNKNWNDRPRHMLQLRALKHCANQIIHGIPYDEDDRVIMGDPINVTPIEQQQPAPVTRAEAKPRKGAALAKEAAKAAEVVVEQEPAQAETVAEVKSEPKNVTPEAAKVVEATKQSEPKSVESRMTLNDGERLTASVEIMGVEAVAAKVGDKVIPSVRAEVKGEFTGTVRHKGAGKMEGDKVVPSAPYANGAKVILKLVGEKSLSTSGPMVGKVIVWVESAEAATETQEF